MAMANSASSSFALASVVEDDETLPEHVVKRDEGELVRGILDEAERHGAYSRTTWYGRLPVPPRPGP